MVKQTDTIFEFRQLFETYSASLPKLAENVHQNTFMIGLQQNIKAKIITNEPIGLESIMQQAQIIEDHHLALKLASEVVLFKKRKKKNWLQRHWVPSPKNNGMESAQYLRANLLMWLTQNCTS